MYYVHYVNYDILCDYVKGTGNKIIMQQLRFERHLVRQTTAASLAINDDIVTFN